MPTFASAVAVGTARPETFPGTIDSGTVGVVAVLYPPWFPWLVIRGGDQIYVDVGPGRARQVAELLSGDLLRSR